ncbi:MAG: hypothetical protein NC548_44595, partial [Lachnospiraceae bacterium]|nr:hypothetical protein [Lachnospiraceae bacterium]
SEKGVACDMRFAVKRVAASRPKHVGRCEWGKPKSRGNPYPSRGELFLDARKRGGAGMTFKCVARIDADGGEVRLYETRRGGKTFVGTFREAYLFAMGFGCDQCAELRYEISKTGGKR